MMRITRPTPPGSVIGIMGGGQLGRMLAMAAARLGCRCIVFAPDEDCVAGARVLLDTMLALARRL